MPWIQSGPLLWGEGMGLVFGVRTAEASLWLLSLCDSLQLILILSGSTPTARLPLFYLLIQQSWCCLSPPQGGTWPSLRLLTRLCRSVRLSQPTLSSELDLTTPEDLPQALTIEDNYPLSIPQLPNKHAVLGFHVFSKEQLFYEAAKFETLILFLELSMVGHPN